MYRSLFVALAVTAASCAYLQRGDRWAGNSTPAMTDVVGVDGDAMAKYDSRDDTIEVIGQFRAARPRLEDRILALVNRERETAGIEPLFFSPQLAKAARDHTVAMAQEGFFEHRGEGEAALFDRVTASGMDTNHVGENIFETNEGVSGAVADECVRMWMQSDGHRLNMLSPDFDKTGIAVRISNGGENYITEDFAH